MKQPWKRGLLQFCDEETILLESSIACPTSGSFQYIQAVSTCPYPISSTVLRCRRRRKEWRSHWRASMTYSDISSSGCFSTWFLIVNRCASMIQLMSQGDAQKEVCLQDAVPYEHRVSSMDQNLRLKHWRVQQADFLCSMIPQRSRPCWPVPVGERPCRSRTQHLTLLQVCML